VGNSNSVTSNFCLQISRNTKWIAFSTLLSWSSLSQSKLKMEEKVRKSERTKICQNKLKKEKELKIRRNKNFSWKIAGGVLKCSKFQAKQLLFYDKLR
jgi:hypothetical protein